MHFNPEINLGTLIEILVFVLAVLGAAKKMGSMEAKLDMVFRWFEQNVINGRHGSEGD